jgi:hypothetical protein
MSEPRQRGPGFLFHAAAGATGLFVVTVLAMIATVFGDAEAPINLWLNRYAAGLLLAEVALIAITGVAAMAWDQRKTQHEQEIPLSRGRQPPESTHPHATTSTDA